MYTIKSAYWLMWHIYRYVSALSNLKTDLLISIYHNIIVQNENNIYYVVFYLYINEVNFFLSYYEK